MTADANPLDAEVCYRAIAARDVRFDGRFFTAVRTTGIFCRSVCPARTPHRVNVDFYRSAAAALGAGFRPCLRCRPERAPAPPGGSLEDALVREAVRLLDATHDSSIEAIAARLGVSDRHLRRLFLHSLGAAPIDVAQSRRVLLAKQLIEDSALAFTDIAFAAGFSSVRRFNTTVRSQLGETPSALRARVTGPGRATGAGKTAPITVSIAVSNPYDAQSLFAFVGGRAFPGVERVEALRYTRAFAIGAARGAIAIDGRDAHSGGARVPLTVSIDRIEHLSEVLRRTRHLLDADAPIALITEHLMRDRVLRPALRRQPGVRIPGAWDPFEIAVRAILGQQISVKAATTLASRIVIAHGEPLAESLASATGLARIFPTPELLAHVDLTQHGVIRARANSINALAQAAQDPTLFDAAHGLEAFVKRLIELPGIGRWTAQYIAMRALGEPDAFPEGDLGLIRSYSRLAKRVVSSRELDAIAEAWRPWRAYAAMLLWLDEAKTSGTHKGG
jgi:AraC family transcriptional regulator, regulatory protein of adaptative response / DNA-3-methyladenine glycosylase II